MVNTVFLLLTKQLKCAAQPLDCTIFIWRLRYMKLIQILTDIVCSTLLDPDALDSARRAQGRLHPQLREAPLLDSNEASAEKLQKDCIRLP